MNSLPSLQALCMDLKRVAIGYHRGSDSMGKRFAEEALKRVAEINKHELKPYMQNVLSTIEDILKQPNDNKIVAEHTLMYSTIIQNYCLSIKA